MQKPHKHTETTTKKKRKSLGIYVLTLSYLIITVSIMWANETNLISDTAMGYILTILLITGMASFVWCLSAFYDISKEEKI